MTIEPGYYFAWYANPIDIEVIYVTKGGGIERSGKERSYALDAFTIGDKIELPDSILINKIINRKDTFHIVQDKNYDSPRVGDIYRTTKTSASPRQEVLVIATTYDNIWTTFGNFHLDVFQQNYTRTGTLRNPEEV